MTQEPAGCVAARAFTARRMSSTLSTGGEDSGTSASPMPKDGMWLCASWKPGTTVRPWRLTTRSASRWRRSSSPSPTATMRPPSTASAVARGRAGSMVRSVPPSKIRSTRMGPLTLGSLSEKPRLER